MDAGGANSLLAPFELYLDVNIAAVFTMLYVHSLVVV